MRLVSYRHMGLVSCGIAKDEGVIDLRHRLGCEQISLRALLRDYRLDELQVHGEANPDLGYSDIEVLPVVADPDKILCVGLNYPTHATELGRSIPTKPSVFLRHASTLVGHRAPLIKPFLSDQFDYEGELAVIIGTGGRHISESEASRHIAGFTCFMDGSVRDYQKVSVTAGKNFPATGSVGPWLVTKDELSDVTASRLTTRLNGQLVQEAQLSSMIFSVEQIIAWCSSFMELSAGDIIATGTPEGVAQGRTPPTWLTEGDRLEVNITGIGSLENQVVEEESPLAAKVNGDYR